MQMNRDGLIVGFLAGISGGLFVNLLLFAGPVAFAQKTTDSDRVLRVGKVELIDQSGKSRAAFALGSSGEPALALFDVTGTPRAGLSLWPSGEPVLELYNSDGKIRASFGYTELQHGISPEEGGKKRSVFSAALLDIEGNIIWRAP